MFQSVRRVKFKTQMVKSLESKILIKLSNGDIELNNVKLIKDRVINTEA